MTFQNRAADARLIRIEKALQNSENRLHAVIEREDAGDATADVAPLHDEIATLVGEAVDLHPVSNVGLASKARIVVKNYELAEVGRPVLFSLVEDLQMKGRRRA